MKALSRLTRVTGPLVERSVRTGIGVVKKLTIGWIGLRTLWISPRIGWAMLLKNVPRFRLTSSNSMVGALPNVASETPVAAELKPQLRTKSELIVGKSPLPKFAVRSRLT